MSSSDRQALLEAASDRRITRERAEEVFAEAERRAAQRRFAAFQHEEVVSMLVASRVALGRRRGFGPASWLALAGVGLELEHEINVRMRPAGAGA